MKNFLQFKSKKVTFILLTVLGTIFIVISSSFKKTFIAQDVSLRGLANSAVKNMLIPQAACNGSFATTNGFPLGGPSAFRILGPGGAGAPGEGGTCSRSSCHNTVDNSGPGTFTIDIGGGVTQYTPGQTYTVTVGINQTGIIAFDFEVTTRSTGAGASVAGSFSVTDTPGTIRTQITSGNLFAPNTNPTYYIEGTACGIDQLSPGYNQWTFNWTAPSSATAGNVTFYLGLVAANFDNATTGDYTYSTTKVLTPAGGVGVREVEIQNPIKLYPNPVAEKISISLNIEKSTNLEIAIFDLKGSKVSQLFNDNVSTGEFNKTFAIHSKLEKGLYFVRVKGADKNYAEKIIIE